jgi:hypothetical protein
MKDYSKTSPQDILAWADRYAKRAAITLRAYEFRRDEMDLRGWHEGALQLSPPTDLAALRGDCRKGRPNLNGASGASELFL